VRLICIHHGMQVIAARRSHDTLAELECSRYRAAALLLVFLPYTLVHHLSTLLNVVHMRYWLASVALFLAFLNFISARFAKTHYRFYLSFFFAITRRLTPTSFLSPQCIFRWWRQAHRVRKQGAIALWSHALQWNISHRLHTIHSKPLLIACFAG
jgi:hypothetical protein